MSKSYPIKDENNILSRALNEAVDTMCFVCRGRKCSECEFDRDYFINKVKEHDEMYERVEEISKRRDWVDLDKTLEQIKKEFIEGKASTVNPLDLIELLSDLQIRRKVSEENADREYGRWLRELESMDKLEATEKELKKLREENESLKKDIEAYDNLIESEIGFGEGKEE